MIIYKLVALLAVIATYHGLLVGAQKMDKETFIKKVKPASYGCTVMNDVSEEMVENTHKGEFPRDQNLMCYFHCLFTNLNLMDHNDEIQVEEIARIIDMLFHDDAVSEVKDIGHTCHKEVPEFDDPCEYAFEFAKCIFEKDSSLHMAH